MSLPKKLIMLAMSMCFFNAAFGMEKDNEANDGLSYVDFCDWFKIRQDKPMAIIQFTDFQY